MQTTVGGSAEGKYGEGQMLQPVEADLLVEVSRAALNVL